MLASHTDCIKVNECINQLMLLLKSLWKSHYSISCNAFAPWGMLNLFGKLISNIPLSLVNSTCTQSFQFLYMQRRRSGPWLWSLHCPMRLFLSLVTLQSPNPRQISCSYGKSWKNGQCGSSYRD